MKPVFRITWMALFVLYLLGVAYLCFSDGKTSLELPTSLWGIPIDKCVHFAMFLPFPILGTIAFHFNSWWRTLCLTVLMANVIAFAFELLQSRITDNRTTDPADLNANILGISVGLLVMIVVGLLRKKS